MKLDKRFFACVLPSMLAFALSGVYAIADGFFVGNALGDEALAAINIAYPLTAFLQAVGTGIGMGGAIQYAICLGGREAYYKDRYFGLSLLLLCAAGLALTLGLLLCAPALLCLLGAGGGILALGQEYLRFIALGAIFQVMGTGLVPFLRNMGGAVAAMAAMMAGFVTNIVLDYTFVWVLPYGMAGAAVATVLGQAVTLAVCAVFLVLKRHKPRLRPDGESAAMVKRVLAVGLSPFGLTFSPNLTLVLVNKSAALVGGDAAVTCYAPISYIISVTLLLLQGVSDGSQPLVSMAHGRGDARAARHTRNATYLFSAAVAAVCMAGLFALRGQAAALFGASPQVTRRVAAVLPVFLAGLLPAAFSRMTTSYFYATARNSGAYLLIYGEPLLLFALLLVLPGEAGGIWGTWAAVPLSQALAALLCAGLLWAGHRRRVHAGR
ncbi:MAG: MATE family efflux transporter [Ruthenibacterium sp.]